MPRRLAVIFGCAAAFATTGTPAADPDAAAYVHLGGSLVKQADDAELFLDGAPLAGASFETELGKTPSLEIGYFIHGGFAIAASAMLPVTTSNVGAGTLDGLGNLGDETVGFYSLAGQYHMEIDDVVSPYVGAGIGYMHVFDTVDGVVTDMSVSSAFGAVLQAGVDIELTENISVFGDVKRYFISTTASGMMGPTPITANARVDPLVLTTGVGISF